MTPKEVNEKYAIKNKHVIKPDKDKLNFFFCLHCLQLSHRTVRDREIEEKAQTLKEFLKYGRALCYNEYRICNRLCIIGKS